MIFVKPSAMYIGYCLIVIACFEVVRELRLGKKNTANRVILLEYLSLHNL